MSSTRAKMQTSTLPAVQVGQTSVISVNELLKIKSQLMAGNAGTITNLSKTMPLAEDQTRRLELHHKSQERVKNWGNTLDAFRLKKERARQDKLDAEENRRVVLDEEERAYQAKMRRSVIERAQKLLFEENDRVKTFNSKISLVDALAEREFQIQIAKDKQQRQKQDEEYWHQKLLENVAEQEAIEARKQEEAMKRALTAKQIQTQQLDEVRERYIRDRLDDRHEGELINARAIADAEEEERRRQDARSAARLNAVTTLQESRKILAEKKRMDKKLEEEEEERVRKHAQRRDEKQRQKEERLAAITQKKLELRQQMIDKQHAHLLGLRGDEAKRLNDQIMKVEQQRAVEEAAKEAKRQQSIAEGAAFNQAQLDLKRRQQEAAAIEGKLEAENLKLMFEEMQMKDLEDTQQRRDRAKHLKNQHRSQMEEKARRKEAQLAQKQHEAATVKEHLDRDDDDFLRYAHTTIQTYKTEGKNVKPLTLQLGRTLKPQMTSA